MNLYEATYTAIYFPTGASQTTATVKLEFYADNYNTAMLIACAKWFAMHNNTDYLVTNIALAQIIVPTT